MQMRRLKAVLALVLAGAFLPVAAEQPTGWQVSGSLPSALTGLKDWTHRSVAGLCVDGGYQGTFEGGNILYRVSLGYNTFPGKEQDRMKISLSSFQLSGDVVIPVARSPYSLVTGLSVHNWSKSVSGTSPIDPGQANGVSGGVKQVFGKIGFRAGVEYSMSPRLTLAALFQISEFGTNSEFLKRGNETFGTNAVNPSWIQMGVRYHF